MASPLQSIGQVLKALQEEFPDISISKIRFLEAEGLISPERAPSGYRRYSRTDIERLAYVLRAQKNHYLPLKVIREHLNRCLDERMIGLGSDTQAQYDMNEARQHKARTRASAGWRVKASG